VGRIPFLKAKDRPPRHGDHGAGRFAAAAPLRRGRRTSRSRASCEPLSGQGAFSPTSRPNYPVPGREEKPRRARRTRSGRRHGLTYEQCLAHELRLRGIAFRRQPPLRALLVLRGAFLRAPTRTQHRRNSIGSCVARSLR
jgi:hypothetical protein